MNGNIRYRLNRNKRRFQRRLDKSKPRRADRPVFTASNIPVLLAFTRAVDEAFDRQLGEEKDFVPLYRSLGEIFRQRCPGWKLFVFTGNAFLARQIGLKHTQHFDLFNGKIPCRLLGYE